MTENNFFQKIQEALDDNHPFVVYRKGTSESAKYYHVTGIFQNDDVLHKVQDFTESGFVIAPFDFSKPSILIPLDKSEKTEASIKATADISTSINPKPTDLSGKAHHLNLVAKGVEAIKNGELKKVVLARKFDFSTQQKIIDIYKSLLNLYPTAFAYCWFHPKIGLWLGATPETLLKISNKNLKTMALAGTKATHESVEPQWTDKEREEQQLVTDFIEETLKGKVNQIKVGPVENIKAGKLWHLKCDISAHLEHKENLKHILEELHPTPAVCGMPKEASKQFIINNENYDREFYTGFIGELNFEDKKIRPANRRNVENQAYTNHSEQTELFVNLRCMQIKKKTCQIYVGGGIVKDSHPESEWQETVNKSQTMLDVI